MSIMQQGSDYSLGLIGDGSTTSVSIDFSQMIANDSQVRNKTPVGVWSHGGADSASISGNIVTIGWTTAPANGAGIGLNIILLFEP